MLPFLPTLSYKFADKTKDLTKKFFEDSDEGKLVRDTIIGLPKAASEQIGQPSMRGFAAAASGLHDIGQRIQGAIDPTRTYKDYEAEFNLELKPTGRFQEELFGTDKKISSRSFGKEIRGGVGGKDLAIDPMLGFMVGFADAVPGGTAAKKTAQATTETAQLVYQKYGPTIGKKIEQLGPKIQDHALIAGVEEHIAHLLNTDKINITIQKLVDGFSDINKARTETESMRVADRMQKAAKAEQAIEGTEGFQSLKAARSAMRGEQPQAGLPNAVIARLDEEETNDLFNYVRSSDLRVYEKTNAMEGLAKMLGDPFYGGKLPTQSELKHLKNVFGEPFVRQYNRTASKFGQQVAEQIAQVANVPRALMSSLDLSAPLRQGLLLTLDRPKNAARAFKSMLRYFVDEEYFNASMDAISQSPSAKLRSASGLELTDVSGQNFSLGTKEEAYMTDLITRGALRGDILRSAAGAGAGSLVGDSPEERMRNALIGAGLGAGSRIGVGASERAYTGYLNKLRADVFDDVAKELMAGGMRPETHAEEFEGVARFINTATGRGEIGGKLAGSAPLLNSMLFSPRFLASRLQFFNPMFYSKLGKEGRKMAARSVMKLVGTGAAVLSLASLNDDVDVTLNPTSSDFGKVRMGPYRYDIWGGFQQVFVLGSRLISGQTTSATTGETRELNADEFFGQTRLDVLSRFGRSKLSPAMSTVVDALAGVNVIGEDVTVSQQIRSKMLPFMAQDLVEAADEEGLLHPSIKLTPGLFGVGVQRFEPRKKDSGMMPSLPSLPKLPSL